MNGSTSSSQVPSKWMTWPVSVRKTPLKLSRSVDSISPLRVFVVIMMEMRKYKYQCDVDILAGLTV